MVACACALAVVVEVAAGHHEWSVHVGPQMAFLHEGVGAFGKILAAFGCLEFHAQQILVTSIVLIVLAAWRTEVDREYLNTVLHTERVDA